MRLARVFCLVRALVGVGAQSESGVVSFGAEAGGDVLCTAAIQEAIDACAAAGGDIVVVPAGTFLTGTLFLKDNVALHPKVPAPAGIRPAFSPWRTLWPMLE